jgi:hypothetical protein
MDPVAGTSRAREYSRHVRDGVAMPLRWLPVVLVLLVQVMEQLGPLPATEPDLDAEYEELVALSASGPFAEKHFGSIAPATRSVSALPVLCTDESGRDSLRQVQCGACGLITYTVKAQRAHRTLDAGCLDPHVDYSPTGLLILMPFYVTRDGRTVWTWPVSAARDPASLEQRERALRLRALEDANRAPHEWDGDEPDDSASFERKRRQLQAG